jgi:hypothetical protein
MLIGVKACNYNGYYAVGHFRVLLAVRKKFTGECFALVDFLFFLFIY